MGVALSLRFFACDYLIFGIYYTNTLTSRVNYAYELIPLQILREIY